MPRKELGKREREEAVSESAVLEKIQRHRPRWADYVSEGIIDSVPEFGPDGTGGAKVRGHGNVVKMLKMNEEANRMASWHGDNRAEGATGRGRREAMLEKRARKNHTPRASIMVPEMPWERRKRNEEAE